MLSTAQTRSRTVLAFFTVMVVAQFVGIIPGLTFLLGAFPTYFHRVESTVIVIALFALLIGSSFGTKRVQIVTQIGIGTLAFYSVYQLIFTVDPAVPPRVLAIWCATRSVVVIVLSWVYIGAFREHLLGWREAFYSLALANVGFVYLSLASLFS